MATGSAEPETADRGTPDDGSTKAPANQLVTRYWREIARYQRASRGWESFGKWTVKQYTDAERALTDENSAGRKAGTRKLATLWSTIETLKPAVYAKTPTAVVSRRFKDNDRVGRIAAEILERASNTAADLYHFDETFRLVRDDRLLPGRGLAWVRYEASFDDVPAEGVEGEEGYAAASKKFKSEKVCLDHLHWQDFGHNICRTWQEVWMVFRKVYKFKAEATERFGKEIAEKLTYDVKIADDDEAEEGQRENKACLYELWDKRRKRMCFMAKGHPNLIEDDEPPLKLQDFFPCPEPAYATKSTDSLIPRADYAYYRDQAEEIDTLTAKIAELMDWLVVKGFIPGGPSGSGADAINTLLAAKGKEIFISIPDWQGFTEKGGARQIDWLPLDAVIQALEGAIKSRAELIQNVYMVMGVSDILRGQTDPDETLGAQELKAQTGSRRARNTKDELARHARDCYRLVCEVIADQFQPETLAAMTGFRYTPGRKPEQPMQGLSGLPGLAPQGMPQPGAPQQPGMPPQGQPGLPAPGGGMQQPGVAGMVAQQAPGGGDIQDFDDEVMERLRNDRIRGYSIDIEADSTVQPDENLEKQSRVEFATMLGGFLEKAAGLFQLGPMAAPLAPVVIEGLKFVVRGFRAGKAMEDVIERAGDQMLKMIAQQASQPPPPSPEEQKAKLEAQVAERQMAMEEAAEQRKAQREAQQLQHEQMLNQQQMQAEAAMNDRKMQAEERKLALQMQIAEREAQIKMETLERQAAFEQAKHSREMEALQANVIADREMAKTKMEAAKAKPNGSASSD